MSIKIDTKDDFNRFVAQIESRDGYRKPFAFGIGIATFNDKGDVLDTSFPLPQSQGSYGTAAILAYVVGHLWGTKTYKLGSCELASALNMFAPFLNDGEHHENIEVITSMAEAAKTFEADGTQKVIVVSFIDVPEHDPGPLTVSDAFLRLYLLSHRKVKPNEINLDRIFEVLGNTGLGQ